MSDVKLPKYKIEKVVSTLSEVIDWGLKQYNIPDTWKITQGEDITVLIIDTGMPVHTDLNSAIIKDKCKSFLDYEKEVEDKNFHGTHCAGIIGARANNIGVVGVAPRCNIITYKVLDKDGSGSFEAIRSALTYALQLKPDIVSMSLGSKEDDLYIHEMIKSLHDANIPCIVASGNDGSIDSVNYPGKYEEVICVSSIGKKEELSEFDSIGIEVDIVAPGENIFSTYSNNGYARLSGTCLTKNVKVYTINGPKSIDTITEDDIVYSFDENKKIITTNKVLKQWSNGIKKTLKLNLARTNIECTYNHPILCKESNNLIWKKAEDIKIGDYVVTNNKTLLNNITKDVILNDIWYVQLKNKLDIKFKELKNYNINSNLNKSTIYDFIKSKYGVMYHKIKSCLSVFNINCTDLLIGGHAAKKINIPIINEDLCYLLGFYLGDGWITKQPRGSQLCIAKCNHDEINKYVLDLFKKLFDIDLKFYQSWYYTYNIVLCEIFEYLCCYEKACYKYIPNWLYNTNKKNVLAFVSGLIDSDGNINASGYTIGTCSKKLIDSLSHLLNYYNITHTNYRHRYREVQPPHSKTKIMTHEYIINLMLNVDEKTGIKQNNKKNNINHFCDFIDEIPDIKLEKVKKIEMLDDQEVFDIEVENNHNFIANNIVVHNSMATPMVAGIVALMLSKHRNQEKETGINDCKTVQQIKEHLYKYSINKNVIAFGKNWEIRILNPVNLINESCLTLPIKKAKIPWYRKIWNFLIY